MAVPRLKTSKMKKRQRRSHHALVAPNFGECPRCNAQKLPHCVCMTCGYYGGEKRVEVAAH
ncbi:MAG: 50S ribosomal protein L32 [Planctomycetota bacterium]|jgi:large subunit ribosomal protein L32|nr:50S ribosomal protein L32 [Planctomycetota bacterium]